MQLKLEVKEGAVIDSQPLEHLGVIMTPSALKHDQDNYWLFRVMVSEKQAVVAFPKFGVIGVGFLVEDDDWNTNLPANTDTVALYQHIEVNKGDVPAETVIRAITMIQEACEKVIPGFKVGERWPNSRWL